MSLPLTVTPLLPEESLVAQGTDWNLCELVRAVDGDTARIRRAQLTWRRTRDDEVGDSLRCERWIVDVIRDDVEELPDGLAGRLVNLDTPERGEPGYREAAADLAAWCARAGHRLRCITYDQGGGFDRMLVDLYVIGEDGFAIAETASQWMLTQGNGGAGWPPYVRGK